MGSTITTVISIPHERQKLLEKEETITNKLNRGDQLEEEKLKSSYSEVKLLLSNLSYNLLSFILSSFPLFYIKVFKNLQL